MTTINGQPQKLTAHDMWCKIILERVEQIMQRQQVHKEVKTKQILQAISHFENTRLRVHVDEIIKHLEALTKEFKDTPRWKFVKRSRIEGDIAIWKQAVQILTNTTPPVEPVNIPHISVSR